MHNFLLAAVLLLFFSLILAQTNSSVTITMVKARPSLHPFQGELAAALETISGNVTVYGLTCHDCGPLTYIQYTDLGSTQWSWNFVTTSSYIGSFFTISFITQPYTYGYPQFVSTNTIFHTTSSGFDCTRLRSSTVANCVVTGTTYESTLSGSIKTYPFPANTFTDVATYSTYVVPITSTASAFNLTSSSASAANPITQPSRQTAATPHSSSPSPTTISNTAGRSIVNTFAITWVLAVVVALLPAEFKQL
jgi:hypothetical protein